MVAERWSPARRVAFRMTFAYALLFLFPPSFLLLAIPHADDSLSFLDTGPLARWLMLHLFHVTVPPPAEIMGGDNAQNWARIPCTLLVAAVITLVWSIVDRRRHAYPRLADLLRTFLRYTLAPVMWGYGWAKVMPLQFPFPPLSRLMATWGDTPRMVVLWNFMGLSRPYCVFTGVVECVGAVLLLWRRTATIGALILAGALTNVFVLNLCYDVPVKEWSAHLLLASVAVASADLVRIARLLLVRHPVRPAPLRVELPSWFERARPFAKIALIVGCAFSVTSTTKEHLAMREAQSQRTTLFGMWNVEASEPPLPDDVRWRRLLVDEGGAMRVENMDPAAARTWYRVDEDDVLKSITMTPSEPQAAVYALLHYGRPDDDHLQLQGDLGGAHVTMRLRRVDQQLTILTHGFHWVQEQPFER